MEQNETAQRLQALQLLLGKYVRVRITHPLGFAYPGGGTYGTNYGELIGFSPVSCKPDGIYILGIHHPARYFDGRVIALISCEGKHYAVAAPKKNRYIVGQIRRALRFAFPEGTQCELQCLYERSCGAVVFRRCEHQELRFLLIKNHRSAHWGFPKGHVENFETAEQTARREVLEETGLRIHLLPGFSCQSDYVISGSIEKSVTIFLAETTDRRTTIQEAEIEDYVWVNYPKALQTLKFENDRNTLRKAWAYLRRQGIVATPLLKSE